MKKVLLVLGIAAAFVTACSKDTTTRRVTTTTVESKPAPSEKTVILTEPQSRQETIILQPKPDVSTHTTYRVETHRED